MVDNRPAFTVLVACLNHSAYLHEALESVAAQTEQDFQLIVTDDGSTDGSQHLIRSWLNDHYPDAIFIAHAQRAGLCRTLNEALNAGTGRLLAAVSADDSWDPNRLSAHRDAFALADEQVAVVYSDARVIDERGDEIAPSVIRTLGAQDQAPSGNVFSELADINFVPALAATYRTELVRAVGGFDETLAFEDWDLLLRLASRHTFLFVDQVVASYRRHGAAMTANWYENDELQDSALRSLLRHAGQRPDGRVGIVRNLERYTWRLASNGHPNAARYARELARRVPTKRNLFYAVGLSLRFRLSTLDKVVRTLQR